MNPLLLFLLLPLVEIAVFIQVGSWIGVLPTIGLILLAVLAGTVLLRRQGLAVLREAQASADRGELPVGAVFRGFCVVAASILLIVPGFVTDLVAVLLLIPHLRAAIGRWLFQRMQRQDGVKVWMDGRPVDPRRPPPGAVIDVEYEEVRPGGRAAPETPTPDTPTPDTPSPDTPSLEESRWRPGGGPHDGRS